jgi:hypothetical protein
VSNAWASCLREGNNGGRFGGPLAKVSLMPHVDAVAPSFREQVAAVLKGRGDSSLRSPGETPASY